MSYTWLGPSQYTQRGKKFKLHFHEMRAPGYVGYVGGERRFPSPLDENYRIRSNRFASIGEISAV